MEQVSENRLVVLDRPVIQGTKSNAGIPFWKVVASYTAQRKKIFKLLTQSLKAYYTKTTSP